MRLAREAEAAERAAAAAREQAAELKRAQEERERREAEESRRRQQEEERQRAQQEAPGANGSAVTEAVPEPQTRPSTAPRGVHQQPAKSSVAPPSSHPDREEEHQRYLQIHRNLKRLRTYVAEQSKAAPKLKQVAGDGRRLIRATVGQLTEDTADNKKRVRSRLHLLELSGWPLIKYSL